MEFFKNIKDLEDLKQQYKELCKKWHPDLNQIDTTEKMKRLNLEYSNALKTVKNSKGENLNENEIETNEELAEIVRQTIILEGLITEICGFWIWFTGDTKKHKETLKRIKCKWASKKKAWYWKPFWSKSRGARGNTTLEEIRSRYGSNIVKNKSQFCVS
jgi:hypothetical protein